MLLDFFYALRAANIPVSTTEFLALLGALRARLAFGSLETFYALSRAILVKDEKHYDRFDRVFAAHFNGVSDGLEDLQRQIPEDWLRKLVEKHLSAEEKAALQGMGWDELMRTLKERLAEQHERHQGGSKWIGTGGTSPFGAYGYNPAGVRIGQDGSRHRRAVKVWDKREFRNLDAGAELSPRNMQVALRRLRAFARQGASDRLDLDATLSSTARHGGLLDLVFRPELRESTKLLLLLDIGGSMDDHIQACEELFSAARSEFKHLEHFYFHNCVYEGVWRDNRRRHSERTALLDVIHKYGPDYKLIFVGDATMSPYEILHPHGSVEHMNAEAGATWLRRLLDAYPAAAWLNPEPERLWQYRQSIGLIGQIMGERMYPLTLDGLARAMQALSRKH